MKILKEFPNIRVWELLDGLAGLSISYIFHWDSPEGVTQDY
jgi:hypothetical protein